MLDVELAWLGAGELIEILGDGSVLIFVDRHLESEVVDQSLAHGRVGQLVSVLYRLAQQHAHAKDFGRAGIGQSRMDLLE
jgi:hypothetical protein